MTLVALPDNDFVEAVWTFDVPQQVNVSRWSGKRTVVRLPGAPRWRVTAPHVPIIGEIAARPWRAFLAALDGSENTFRMIAVEEPQHAAPEPRAATGVLAPMTAGANTSVTTGSATRNAGSGWATARSTAGYTGDFDFGFTPAQTTADIYVGAMPASYTDPASLPGPWFRLKPGGTYDVGDELTPLGAPRGAYAAGDRFSIQRRGNAFNLYRNSISVNASTMTAGTRLLTASFFNAGTVRALTAGVPVAGLSSVTLTGLPPSATTLTRGMLATLVLTDGTGQLVVLQGDVVADAHGTGVANFRPDLRGPVQDVLEAATVLPWCDVALDDPRTTLSAGQGQIYTLALAASEAF